MAKMCLCAKILFSAKLVSRNMFSISLFPLGDITIKRSGEMLELRKGLDVFEKRNEFTRLQANGLIRAIQLMEEYTLQQKKAIIELIKRDTILSR